MTKLEELIKELCPNGVEYIALSAILKIKNGRDYKQYGQGDIPVYGSGGIMAYIDTAVYEKPSVLIPRKGSLDKLYYVEKPFWTVDTIFYTEIDTEKVFPKYVFYVLQKEHMERLNKAGGVPSLTQNQLSILQIPLPPLAVQCEIVRILDDFTLLSAELAAELIARRKQYKYYRDKLLSFDRLNVGYEARWVKVREVSHISRGKVLSKDYIRENAGDYPVFSSQTENAGILGYIKTFDYEGEYLTWTTDGANAGTVFYRNGRFNITNVCGLIEVVDKQILIKYLYYILHERAPKYVSAGMGNPKLMRNVMEAIKIPIPPLDVQKKIVEMLDKFDKLCNDLSEGLPAEIEARQKQYEYYRDKLLTFEGKVG